MPQMKPMLWLPLLYLMILSSLASIMLIHFFFPPVTALSPTKNISESKVKFTWQW